MTSAGPNRVPFLDLHRATERIRPALNAAIARVIDGSWFVLGEEVKAFEYEFAEACGVEHVVGVASGTDAIELGLRALKVGRGDEVITQANTCVPTVAAIVRAGATPVLCDVDLETATIDPRSLQAAISARTRAIVPVHLYGQCAPMEQIRAIATAHDLAIVEDCAQALGATSTIGAAGTHGQVGAFSFYPTKHLGALGDAGAIVTPDSTLAERARQLRQYGFDAAHKARESAVNSRLDELQAAILRVKLPLLARDHGRRRAIAARYDAALADTQVNPLRTISGHVHSFQSYVVRVANRGCFRQELDRLGVQTLIHYPTPIHHEPAYRELPRASTGLARAEQLTGEVVSLPIYPELSDEELELVIGAVRTAASACRE